MVTMTINFNDNKLKEKGYAAEQLLSRFDEYCQKYDIQKPSVNVFEKDGIHALAIVGDIMYDIMYNDELLYLIDSWYWYIDEEKEDLLEGAYRLRNKR